MAFLCGPGAVSSTPRPLVGHVDWRSACEVQLEFTGRGGSATISISGVTADQEIQISVTLNSNNARGDSEHRNKRGDGTREDLQHSHGRFGSHDIVRERHEPP